MFSANARRDRLGDGNPHTMHPASRPIARLSTLLVLVLLPLALLAAEPVKSFDIPAGEAAATLKQAARQAGIQIMFPAATVRGVKTGPIKGEFTAREAIDRMLAGTELTVVRDEKSGALTVARAKRNGELDPNVERAIANSSDRPTSQLTKAEDGMLEMSAYEVTGSRIRRDPAELGVSPVQVFDRRAIARSGAISISDFTRQLTQNANDLTGLTSTGGPIGARTTVNLRGLGAGTTLVLVNGRRIPRSGQAFNLDDYDLAGIPPSAVERIEVLTDGASAVYGADAIGGVINIITRKDFQGAELTLQYGNPFRSDAAERSASLFAGYARARHGGSITVNVTNRNSFGNDQRPYTATSDHSASGGRDGRDFFSGGEAGYLIADNLLPGLSTSDASIPPGQNGLGLTRAAFAPYQGVIFPLDGAPFGDSVEGTESGMGRADWHFDLHRAATFYTELSHTRSRTIGKGPPPLAPEISVPAENPFNPFGVDLLVSKSFHELGRSTFIYDSRNENIAAGLRGEWGRSWRYDASFTRSRLTSASWSPVPDAISFNTITPLASRTDPASALNVFGDGRLPVSSSHLIILRSALGVFEYSTRAENDVFDLHADGVLRQTRAGAIRASVGAEHRLEGVSHRSRNTTGKTFSQLAVDSERKTAAGYGELEVPLLGEGRNFPLARSLVVHLAGRYDDTAGFDPEFSPKYGAIWQPVRALRLRASVSEGFKTPNLFILAQPTTTRNTRYSAISNIVDRARNELIVGTLSVSTGGNPRLRPESSRSKTYGMVFEPARIRGLSMSADYHEIRYVDRVISTLREQDIIDFFPERFTRAAAVNGVPGRILSFDRRAANLDSSRSEGMDFKVSYQHEGRRGRWNYAAAATRNLHLSLRSSPSAPTVERVDSLGMPKWRTTASIAWENERAEAGVAWRYVASTRNALTFPARIEAASEFDVHAGYRFAPRGEGRRAGLLRDLKVDLGVQNVLDTTPPPTNGAGGYAVLDPRQRRYWISIGKQL